MFSVWKLEKGCNLHNTHYVIKYKIYNLKAISSFSKAKPSYLSKYSHYKTVSLNSDLQKNFNSLQTFEQQ